MADHTQTILAWLLPTSHYSDPHHRRRALLLAAVCFVGIVVGILRATAFGLTSQWLDALAVSFASITSLVVLLLLRLGLSLWWSLIVQGSVLGVVIVVIAVNQGGVGTPVLAVLAALPLVTTYIKGTRAGLATLGLVWATVLLMSGLESSGLVSIDDTTDPTHRHLIDTLVALIIPAVLLGLGTVYERSYLSAVEQVRRERESAERDINLLRRDKMTTVGLLSAGVGHEINTPLMSVQTNIDFALSLLDKQDPQNSPVIQALSDARVGTTQITKITSDLRTLSQVEGGRERTPVELDHVASTALGLTRQELEYRTRVETELTQPPSVLAVESRLVQVVVNLLVNAAHAVESGDNPQIVVRSGIEKDLCWLEIADNGPGISADVQARIFDPFFTTKEVGQGTGLGLSVSSAIVRAAGGTLSINSQEGVGSTFRLSLPRTTKAASAEEVSVNAMIRHSRILFIDDDPLLGRAFTRLLNPHEVSWFETGQEALDLLETDTAFDLILCDVMMNPMTGWDVLEQVKTSHPNLVARFAFLTGGAFTQAAHAQMDNTEVPVLYKPVNLSDILELIESVESQ